MSIPATASKVVDEAYLRKYPCTLASSSRDGMPNIGFKGSMFVFDENSLAFWERSKRTHLKNIRENSRVAVLCWDSTDRTGFRFKGNAKIVEDGAIKDQIWSRINETEKSKDPEKSGYAILIRVDEVLPMGKARQSFSQ
ncbi:MAG: pyridoxamine 5'-phosphate oxidase family protein [Thaumarchaeota archaeon]|nr:pyridoxamine 5'-phosphate oxidase family protein [Nitrososphaerota archaeon]